MPRLIQNITAELLDNFVGEVRLFNTITGQVQGEDYVNLNGLICYLQNFSRIEYTSGLNKPISFGLQKTNNTQSYSLEISY